ncbi:hypothetical protein MMC07_008620 [Pseudocyphellaria aurata]|nr:hypothetical protein [Pseudocyphellaria aurata]
MATLPLSPTPKEGVSQQNAMSRPTTPVKDSMKENTVQKDHQEPLTPASPVTSSTGDHHEDAFTAVSSLQKSGEVSSTIQDLFKDVSGVDYRFDLTQNDLIEEAMPALSEAQRGQIENGEAVALGLGDNKRVVLLPDGRALWGFTEEQAQRYLELRKKTLSTTEPAFFNSFPHDIDRSIQAISPAATAVLPKSTATSSTEDSEVTNPFEDSLPIPASAAATPSYWSSAPLTEEAMASKLSNLSVEEAEQALLASQKETEEIEKKLNEVMKKNRQLLFGNPH